MLSERPGEVVDVNHVVDCLAQANERAAELDREQLLIEVYHNHLPKLAEHDFVEFDPRRGVCRYHTNKELETILKAVQEWRSE